MRFKFSLVILIIFFFTAPLFAADREVTLAASDWAPYIGSDMPNYGCAAEIIVEAYKRAGYKVNIVFYPAWIKAMNAAKAGQADGFFPAYYAKNREEHYVFSDSFAKSPVGLLKKTSRQAGPPVGSHKKVEHIVYPIDPRFDQTEALRGLKQYKFGVVSGYANTPEFDAAIFLKKEEALSDEVNLKKLFNDQVQLVFIDKYVANYIIFKKYPWYLNEYQFMEPPLEVKPLHIAFSKKTDNYEQKKKAFNLALELIKKDGVLKRILGRYGF